MENQKDINTTTEDAQKKSKARALLIGIIAALLLINGALLYMYFKKSSDAKNTETVLTESNNELSVSLETAEGLIIQYQQDSLALAGKNIILSDEIIAKKNEIAALVSQLRSKGKASSKELNALKTKIGELQGQIAKLEAENAELKTANSALNEEKTQLLGQNSQLSQENQSISAEKAKYKSVAQRLQAGNITLETTKKRWIDKKEVATDKAKDVENIKIAFNILENNLADDGERTIFVKITGPNGTTITNPGSEGGTFPFENYESRYTYKMSTDFNKEAKSGPTTVWRPRENLKPGKYTVEFYTEGYRMGVSTFSSK